MLGIFPEENEPRPTKTVILLESQISFRLRNSPFPHLHLRNKTQSARKWAPCAVGWGALRGYDAFSDCTSGATLWDATRMLQREGATPAAPLDKGSLWTEEEAGSGQVGKMMLGQTVLQARVSSLASYWCPAERWRVRPPDLPWGQRPALTLASVGGGCSPL